MVSRATATVAIILPPAHLVHSPERPEWVNLAVGCWVQRLLPAYLQATAAQSRQVERSMHCDYGLHMTQRPTHGIRLVYGGGGAYTG